MLHNSTDSIENSAQERTGRRRELTPTRFIILAAIILPLVIFGASRWLQTSPAPQGSAGQRVEPKVGSRAPDFELKDVQTGEPVKLSSLRGRPVWVNFWASWCEACREEMPAMKQLHARYKAQNLAILGIDVQESAGTVKEHIAANGYDWTFAIDTDGTVTDRYFVHGIPAHFFIDEEGVIRAMQIGEAKMETVEGLLETILGP